jgi:quercetin 2,3-dioxygenase
MAPQDVPRLRLSDGGGVTVRVLAGECLGVAGAVQRPVTEPLVLDVTLPPGTRFDAPIPPGHNAFVHVFAEPGTGAPVDIGPAGDTGPQGASRIPLDRMAILTTPGDGGEADGVTICAPADAAVPARVLLVAGRPLREPVVQYGPFVMNTAEQIHQAVADFQSGRLAR